MWPLLKVSGVCLGAAACLYSVFKGLFPSLLSHLTWVCWWKVSVSMEDTHILKRGGVVLPDAQLWRRAQHSGK